MRYLVYARVSPRGSSWAGGETTVPDQIASCRQYALARDPAATFEVVQDEFQSGSSARRPGYRRIIDALSTGNPPWDVLIVRHLDRLTRSLTDAIPLLALLRDCGRGLVAVSQNLDLSNPTGRAMLHIILTFAQWEREMCSERTKAKMVSICEAGGWPVGLPPYGYRRAGKGNNVLVPDPARAPAVHAIYLRYAKGESPIALCREYGLARNSLWNLLRNPIYRGAIWYGGVEYPGKHEALVSRSEWDAVQPRVPALPDGRKPRTNAQSVHVYLLAGLVRCKCGKAMTAYSSRGRHGEPHPYYQCTDLADCRLRVPAAFLERHVLDAVRSVHVTPGEIEAVIREIRKRRDADLTRSAPALRKIDRRLAEIGRLAAGMENAMALGKIDRAGARAWNERYAAVHAERQGLEAKRAAIAERHDGPGSPYRQAEAAARELGQVAAMLASARDAHEVRRIIASHVATVEVTGKKEPPVVRLSTGEGLAQEPQVASRMRLLLTLAGAWRLGVA